MKLASVNPMFFDLAMDLDTLMVRPDQERKIVNIFFSSANDRLLLFLSEI